MSRKFFPVSCAPKAPVNLSFGRTYAAIPGPSVVPDRVLNAMHRASPNIYAGPLIDQVADLHRDLKVLAGTRQHIAPYISNGHGLWEAANCNLFSRGDKVLMPITGTFGQGWAQSLRAQGVEVEAIDFGLQTPVDPARIEARLRQDLKGEIRAVLTTHVDTASSMRTDIKALRQAIDAAGHGALLGVDCIATMGCDEFRMDEWGVDLALAASQKGLMSPAGMGFLWLSESALRAGKNADLRTPYWDWTPRVKGEAFWQFWGGTPPSHHIFALSEVMQIILREEGLENVWARHDRLARTVWAAFDAWSEGNPRIGLNVARPQDRGRSVTAARMGAPDATRLREWCEREAGVTLGIGLGMAAADDPAWHGFLRIAHMGHVNAHMTLGVLAVMEAGMRALYIPFGQGGLAAATAVVAGG